MKKFNSRKKEIFCIKYHVRLEFYLSWIHCNSFLLARMETAVLQLDYIPSKSCALSTPEKKYRYRLFLKINQKWGNCGILLKFSTFSNEGTFIESFIFIFKSCGNIFSSQWYPTPLLNLYKWIMNPDKKSHRENKLDMLPAFLRLSLIDNFFNTSLKKSISWWKEAPNLIKQFFYRLNVYAINKRKGQNIFWLFF